MGGPPWWALLILADVMLGMSVRSGLVAFVCGGGVVLLFRPRVGRLMLACLVGMGLLVAMAAFDWRLTPPGASREFSFDLLKGSLQSVVGDSEREDLKAPRAGV